MGWALENLTADARERIARTLFEVKDETPNSEGWLNGMCPFHADSNPSLGYNVDTDCFVCFASCVESSDLVDLWCLQNGYPAKSPEGFKAFKREFAQDMGVGSPKRKTPGQLNKREKTPVNAIPESVYRVFEAIPEDMLKELWRRRGWSREVIDRLGIRVLSHFRKKSKLYDLFPISERERVVLPVRDGDGVLWNLRVYYPFGVPEGAGDEVPKIMSWGKGHGSARLFPSPSTLRPEGAVLLCEGEADVICAISHGFNAITQTGKPSHWPEEQLKALAGRKVVIAYDADVPGQEHAFKAAKNLVKASCDVYLLEWPDFMGRQADGTWPETKGQDITDFFVRHGKEAVDFMVLMDKAKPFDPNKELPPEHQGQDYLAFFGMSASGRFTFRERALADYLLETYPMLYHDSSGQLYRWEGTYYEPWSEEQLRRAAIEALGDEATSTRVNAACSLAMSLVSMPHGRDLNDQTDWVCLKNGMFNLYTLELKPHDPSYLATIKLGVSWHGLEPQVPKRWYQYLAETIQTPEVINQAQEFAGYCMTRETKFGKSLLLLGPGSDGKSKFIAVLRALVGPKNCSAVSMTGLDDQFQRAALFGKVLNVATEITTDAIQSEMFKAVVTGDPIQASFKHKDSFEFVPYAKLVFASNKMPRVLDNSDGYFRRLLPVLFKQQFLEGDAAMDPDLELKLMAELDGIFAWAVVGLHRLREQKRFTMCDETLDFMMRYRRYNNPVMGFVQDRCTLDRPEGEVELKTLYKEYREYCRECGFNPMNQENFSEELITASRKLKEDAALRKTRPRKANGDRPYVITGIALKPVVPPMDGE